MKDIKGKAALDLLPYEALVAMAAVRTFGVNKYGDAWAWKEGVDPQAFATASIRQLYKYLRVENLDDESDLPHLAHAAASAMMALQIYLEKEKANNER